jgi:hypothetical protein
MKTGSVFLMLMVQMVSLSGQEMRTRSNEVYVNLSQVRSKTTTPIITWITPRQDYAQTTEILMTIEADIRSTVPLQHLGIKISDKLSGEIRGEKKFELGDQIFVYHLRQPVSLPEDVSYIEIVAENINGAKVSATRIILSGVDAVANAVSIDRKDYALLIATDKYDNWNDLVNPVADAKEIAIQLKNKFNFETKIIENPEQAEIIEAIRDYSSREFKPQDQLFIFFAGHGQFDDVLGEGYVVTKNSLDNDKSKTSYLSHSNLRTYVNNIPCKHILLAMDVCFGGTFDPVIAKTRAAEYSGSSAESEFLARKLSKKTRLYVTSGGKEYVSDGLPGKHSPFAARLIEALDSNGGDDHILTTAELNSFLEKIQRHEPRFGEFGDNEKGSDFVFVLK